MLSQVNWPDWYRDSLLSRDNEAYAEQLVARDRGILPPLSVSSMYAADFGTQVGRPVESSRLCAVCSVQCAGG